MLFIQVKGLYLAWKVYGKLYEAHIISYVLLPIILYAATYFLPYVLFKVHMKKTRRLLGEIYVLRLQKEGYYVNNVVTPWNKAKKALQCRYGIVQISYIGPTIMITSNSVSKEEYNRMKNWMNL